MNWYLVCREYIPGVTQVADRPFVAGSLREAAEIVFYNVGIGIENGLEIQLEDENGLEAHFTSPTGAVYSIYRDDALPEELRLLAHTKASYN